MSNAKDRKYRRPKKRCVTVRLEARNAKDQFEFLQVIEEVFTPSDLKIELVSDGFDASDSFAPRRMGIEVLETEVNADTGKHLDEKDRRIRGDRESSDSPVASPTAPSHEDLEKRKAETRKWIERFKKVGWFIVRVGIEAAQLIQ